jgi:hypothetical protein
MRLFSVWPKLRAVAPTLSYDGEIVKPYQKGEPFAPGQWNSAKMPTLVLDGGKSPQWMRNGMKTLARILPNAAYRTLEGKSHDVAKAAVALEPVLNEFFGGK